MRLFYLFNALVAIGTVAATTYKKQSPIALQNPLSSNDPISTTTDEESSADDLDIAPTTSNSMHLIPHALEEHRRAPAILDTLPTGSTPVTSGYYYSATCADSKCSTVLEQIFTVLSTCFTYGGSTYQVTASTDATVTTKLYYLTTTYSDSACKTVSSSVLNTVSTTPAATSGTTRYQAWGTATTVPSTTSFYTERWE
jgi:hypothetical protein